DVLRPDHDPLRRRPGRVAGEQRQRGRRSRIDDPGVGGADDLLGGHAVGVRAVGHDELDLVARHELVDVAERMGVGHPVPGEAGEAAATASAECVWSTATTTPLRNTTAIRAERTGTDGTRQRRLRGGGELDTHREFAPADPTPAAATELQSGGTYVRIRPIAALLGVGSSLH